MQQISCHKAELENLTILSQLKHPNIIELLASYSCQGTQNLIFPLAEGKTLKEMFSHDRQTTPWTEDADLLIAAAGLSSAIEHVHDLVEESIDLALIGCHYDLRPDNILVSGNTLLLADFGLSRFKDITDGSATIFKQGGGDYRAPECEDIDDTKFTKQVIHRSSDIWSFGCILGELITYMTRGPDGVKEFRARRRFKAIVWHFLFHCGLDKPNEAVSDWLAQIKLGASRQSTMFLELIDQMLCIREKDRPKAKEVTGKLRLIALYEVAGPVDECLSNILTGNSYDAQIERARFNSWRYALGINDQQTSTYNAEEVGAWSIFKFEAILNDINSMKDLSKFMSSQPQGGAPLSFYRLSELNVCLYQSLSIQLQDKSKLFLSTSISALQDVEIGPDTTFLPTDIRVRLALKHMTKIAMDHWERESCQRQLDPKTISVVSKFGDHDIGKLQRKDVSYRILIEWRPYGRQSADEAINHQLFARADAIVELLAQGKTEGLRALDSQGFFHDQHRSAFGVVYKFPNSIARPEDVENPVSLWSLLEQTFEHPRRYPAFEDRFRIAAILSRSILEFRMVNWLHKRLSSFNVAFFPTSTSLEDEWFQCPYIIGFSHSRPDEVSAFTGGPESSASDHYQHPMYLQNQRRYCQEFDYYSFGIVLLEIGLWKPLHNMIEKFQGNHDEIRQQIIRKRLPLLKSCMGRQYLEIVRTCLQSDFPTSKLNLDHTSDSSSVRLEFNEKVVCRLEQLSAGFLAA
ncbi:hypothetical protein NX059_009646 [Plenodomus lindquistii]|nr:hypothetical protein NX059_009646 [Plenodomus lindquistii]